MRAADRRQRLLLAAASWHDDRGQAAWEEWREGFHPDRLTLQEQRLLPAVYRPLRDRGVDDPALALARTLYRRTWFVNNLALRRATLVVARLQERQIPVLVLKGVALALIHYRDMGARPMNDIDLLVGPAHEQPAVDVLRGVGYEIAANMGTGHGPLNHGTHLEDADGNEIDLHAFSLLQSVDDADLWEDPVELELSGGAPALALGPADQLLHVCAHGVRWSADNEAGWVADAMAILRSSGPELDWERLAHRAEARRLTVALDAALTFLRESMEAPVPAWVTARLRAAPKLRFEAAVHRASAASPSPPRFALQSWDRYRRIARLGPPERRPGSFLAFLQDAWQLDSPARVLPYVARKLGPGAVLRSR